MQLPRAATRSCKADEEAATNQALMNTLQTQLQSRCNSCNHAAVSCKAASHLRQQRLLH
jgi:hypothetical protein